MIRCDMQSGETALDVAGNEEMKTLLRNAQAARREVRKCGRLRFRDHV